MEAGLPVICTDFRSWKQITDKYNCGICVKPSDVDALKDAILFLTQNKKQAYEMG